MFMRALIIVMGLAGLALLGGAMVSGSRMSYAGPAPAPAPPNPEVQVLVAARALDAGTLLRESDLRWQAWPVTGAPEGYVAKGTTEIEAVVGAVTRRVFLPGDPLVQGQFVTPGERGFLAAVLEPGMRAVSVAVDAVTATSGLIWPGDRVDLILTQEFSTRDTKDARRAASETILSDVRVLAIDQRLSEAKTGEELAPESRAPKTVALEVKPRDAEIVRLAADLGKLTLALRSIGDEVALSGARKPVWASDVSGALRAPAQQPPQGPRIYRGGENK